MQSGRTKASSNAEGEPAFEPPDVPDSCTPARILLTGDSPILRSAVRLLIATRPELLVAFETSNCPTAIGRIDLGTIDIALMDFDLNDTTEQRLLALQELLKALVGVPVLILTADPEVGACQCAFRYGAKGLILKDKTQEELFGAVARVRRGEVWLEGPALARMFTNPSPPRKGRSEVEERIARLTKREREIIRVAGHGLTNRQIAQQLSISEATVRHHLYTIFDKLGVATRCTLMVLAYCYCLADPPKPDAEWLSLIRSESRSSSSFRR